MTTHHIIILNKKIPGHPKATILNLKLVVRKRDIEELSLRPASPPFAWLALQM